LRIEDREMIREVYAGSYRRLVVQLYAVTGDLADAQEVVQEAFVQLLVVSRRLPHIENPEAWLRTVAVNLARTRSRRRRILDGLLRRIGEPPPAVPGTAPEHIAVVTALRKLPIGQRLALALHYLADQPVDQVARTLGVSIGTVKSRLARGRAALAVLLDDEADDSQPVTHASPVSVTPRSVSTRARSSHV
jgi:RNA polymerase sigma-70 factor (ECF subfamily)